MFRETIGTEHMPSMDDIVALTRLLASMQRYDQALVASSSVFAVSEDDADDNEDHAARKAGDGRGYVECSHKVPQSIPHRSRNPATPPVPPPSQTEDFKNDRFETRRHRENEATPPA